MPQLDLLGQAIAVYHCRPHELSDFSKNFRFQIVYSNHMALWPPLSAAIEGRGLGNCEFEPSVSRTRLLV